MWQQITKLASKIIIIVLPVVVLMQIFCATLPMVYMDGEYAMYRQQKDYIAKETDYNRVVIFGDSRSKAGFMPDILGNDVYNLSLGGITPVETYYMLQEYVENHGAPEYLILAYAPLHLCRADENNDGCVLWNRCIYFHTFNQADFFELARERRQYDNSYMIDRDHIYLEYAMYQLYFPNKYGTALKNAIFGSRYHANMDKYAQMEAQRGYSLFGVGGVNGGINGEAKMDDFTYSDLTDAYLNKIFAYCREQNIKVVLEQLPMTETSAHVLTDDFYKHYQEYLNQIAQNNPDVLVNPYIESYSDTLFGDADHLSTEGAAMFSNIIRERYPQIFYNQSE